jgi:hypothetical protein
LNLWLNELWFHADKTPVNRFDDEYKEFMSKILLCLLLVGCCLVAGACMFVNQPQFGKQSAESSLDAIANSSHYYDGEFHNLTPTSVLSDDSSTFSILMSNLFSSAGRLRPVTPVPTIKTELKKLDKSMDQVLWFGHSSCFVQLGGKAIPDRPCIQRLRFAPAFYQQSL